MSWLEDYDRWGVEQDYQVIYLPIEADLNAWEEYVEEGLPHLVGLEPEEECDCPEPCWCVSNRYSNLHSQEDADIGEEILGG